MGLLLGDVGVALVSYPEKVDTLTLKCLNFVNVKKHLVIFLGKDTLNKEIERELVFLREKSNVLRQSEVT